MRILAGFLFLAFIFGCLAPPSSPPVEPPGQSPDINVVDQNIFGDTNGPGQLVDVNSINIDFNQNRILFNFEVDLNSENPDLNILAGACDVVCKGMHGSTWKITKDINFGNYYCTCTVCHGEEETSTVIYRYCSDHKFGFGTTLETEG